MVVIGTVFFVSVFGVFYRVLHYVKSVEEIGSLLAGKILSVILLAFGSILLLSNLVTALSTFFLAKDMDLLVSAPVDWGRLYVAKLVETLVHSSWMVVLVAVPILTAYGIVYDGGLLFPLVAIGAMVPFLVLPSVIGVIVTQVLVNIFPARRARDLLSLVALGAAAGLVMLLRLVQPERLARPEGFHNLIDFISLLQTPTHPLLPSEWASAMMMNWFFRIGDPLPPMLLWTTAAAFVVIGGSMHRRLFPSGFTKAQEGSDRRVPGVGWRWFDRTLLRWLPPARREFILKDLRLFFRDTTQWSQLVLLAVLLIVYVFNIRALPLFTGERVPYILVTVIVFLNQGLAGFVLSAIAARFVFPSISLEGRQLWLLRSSPLDLRSLLWSKYWIGTLPLLIVAVGITVVTNNMLHASGLMMAISVGTTACYTIALGGLALGFGTMYPQFETENAAQIPTSVGGLLFMMTAVTVLGAIIVIEARPVAAYLRALQSGQPVAFNLQFVGSLAAVVVVCAGATFVPLSIARRRLEALEA